MPEGKRLILREIKLFHVKQSLVPQRHQRIHLARAPRRYPASQRGHGRKKCAYACQRYRIARRYSVEHGL
jgi:hypothetical protein